MVAYRLVDLVGRASAANILGITVRELDKLVEVFETSRRFTELRDPAAAITWARELMGVSKKLLAHRLSMLSLRRSMRSESPIPKTCENSRTILPDPVARAHFLTGAGDLESAQLRIRPAERKHKSLKRT